MSPSRSHTDTRHIAEAAARNFDPESDVHTLAVAHIALLADLQRLEEALEAVRGDLYLFGIEEQSAVDTIAAIRETVAALREEKHDA